MPAFFKNKFCGTLLLLTILLVFGQALAQGLPVKDFEKAYKWRDKDIPKLSLQTSDGNFVLAGITRDVDHKTGQKDEYLFIKLDPQGKELVKKNFGCNYSEELETIQQTADGGFILGGNSSSSPGGNKSDPSKGGDDFWLVKTDADGNKLWDKSIGGSGTETLIELHQTPDGGFLLGGTSSSGVSGNRSMANNGFIDYWIISLDAAGNKRWDRNFGSNFNGKALYSLYPTPDGGCFLTSFILQPGSATNYDIYLLKMDAAGYMVWERTYGGNKGDGLYSLLPSANGDVLLIGSSDSGVSGDKTTAHKGNSDIWLLKINANGNKLWDKSFGGRGYDNLKSLKPTPDGGYVMLGYSSLSRLGKKIMVSGRCGSKREVRRSVDYGRGYWAAKLDANGKREWEKTFGLKKVWLSSLQPTPDQGYVMVGNLNYRGNKHRNVNLIKLNSKGQKSGEMVACHKEYQVSYDMQVTPNGSCIIEGRAGIGGASFQTEYYMVKLGPGPGKIAAAAKKK